MFQRCVETTLDSTIPNGEVGNFEHRGVPACHRAQRSSPRGVVVTLLHGVVALVGGWWRT